MNINLQYFVKIVGQIPCGENGIKSEEDLKKDLPKFASELQKLITDELCCHSLTVTVKQVK